MIQELVKFIRKTYRSDDFIPLHAPCFEGNEMEYVSKTIESTFVSSVGKYVDKFEAEVESFTGAEKAVATVNGTAALHAALFMSGVKAGDLVVTQALTFVATTNAINQMGAEPLFVDVSRDSLGLCPQALEAYLDANALINDEGFCEHISTNKIIRAVVPMHTFGHPVDMDELLRVCKCWNIVVVEDAAESLGSYYKGRHTGTMGRFAALSFNGNKIITTGGGGMILCANQDDGQQTKHITTTAKVPHAYEFYHDSVAFNYRMPNINAALGCAQIERLSTVLKQKRLLAEHYKAFFEGSDYTFVQEPEYAKSNYWLNAVVCKNREHRDQLLEASNDCGVMTRPIWALMTKLPMHKSSIRGDLSNSLWLESRVVNLPSSPVELGV